MYFLALSAKSISLEKQGQCSSNDLPAMILDSKLCSSRNRSLCSGEGLILGRELRRTERNPPVEPESNELLKL